MPVDSFMRYEDSRKKCIVTFIPIGEERTIGIRTRINNMRQWLIFTNRYRY